MKRKISKNEKIKNLSERQKEKIIYSLFIKFYPRYGIN